MKRTVIAMTIASIVGFSAMATAQEQTKYGQEFAIENVMTTNSFSAAIKDKNVLENIKLEGRISQVCQSEGCWIKLKNDAGEDILVKFKDHAFLVPKDISGKAAIVYGTATRKVISVKERQHMAEDAGASKKDIANIKEPKEEVRIDATGLIVM